MCSFSYKTNSASKEEIEKYLIKTSNIFSSPLVSRVDISSYSKKIKELSFTFECWHQDCLVGLVACYLNDSIRKEGFVTNVSVLKEYQEKGIATKLLNQAINQALVLEFSKISLEVSIDNNKAINFYKKNNFNIEKEKKYKYKMSNNLEKKEILVSICCITYNHESFIRECLDGFLMQKTNFKFEVLIHDDASTDNTANIIREYEQKYPEIIKPIYQTENQYSRGVEVSTTYNFPRAKGKYIAMCEGDDYWIDPYKLQKQVDFLEANPEFSICFHSVKVKKEEEGVIVDDYITRDVPDVTDIYLLAGGNYMHTASVVFRKNMKVIDDLSQFQYTIDYTLHMLNAQYGKIKKMQEEMAVYRVHRDGVWSLQGDDFKSQKYMILLKCLMLYFVDCDKMIFNILNHQYVAIACHTLSIFRENGVSQEAEIVELIKDVSEVSPFLFAIELNKRIVSLERIITNYRRNIAYKAYMWIKNVIRLFLK